jgi:hypothetical protein
MSTENPGVRLGDLLTSAGLLKIDALREAMLTAKQQNMPVGRILITSGYLTENQLQAAVQAQSLLKDGLVEMPIVVKALGLLVHEQTSLEQAMARCGWHKESGAVTNKLGELLLESQIISKDDLDHALAQCENIGLPLGRMLVLTSCLTEQMLSNALNAQVLLRDHKITRAQAIKGLQAAQKRQVPLESTLTESDDLQLPSSTNVRLGEFLIDAGLIDNANLMNAVEIGLVQGKLIGLVLRQLNLLSEKDLDAALELQKMIAAGSLRRREATEMLAQIHTGKASLQDILKRKQDPYSLDDEPDKGELFMDQFLKIAGIITQNDIDKAIRLGTQDSDLFGKMLLSAGIMEEQMVEASLDAYALVSDDTLTMDQAMIALKNCQVRGHSLEAAFKDLGWSADVEGDEDESEPLEMGASSESISNIAAAPAAEVVAAVKNPPESFAPVAVPVEPVKETPRSSPDSYLTPSNPASTSAPISAPTPAPTLAPTSAPTSSAAAPVPAHINVPSSSPTSADLMAPLTSPTGTIDSSQKTTAKIPRVTESVVKQVADPIASAIAEAIAMPIAPTSRTSVPPRATTTQTIPNNTTIPSVVALAATAIPEAITPASQSSNATVDQQTRTGSEFPTITPVVSKRANSSTGDYQKYVSTSIPSSADLSPKPSYNLPPQTPSASTSQSQPVSSPLISAAKPAAASEVPVRTEPVTSARYGTSKEFAPKSDPTPIESPQAQTITVVPARAEPPAIAPVIAAAPSFTAVTPVAQASAVQAPVEQPFFEQAPFEQAQFEQAPFEHASFEHAPIAQAPTPAPTPTAHFPFVQPPSDVPAPTPLPAPFAPPTPEPSPAPSQSVQTSPIAPAPLQEVRTSAPNAISALNASWGFGSKQGPQSNPWDAIDEQPENPTPNLISSPILAQEAAPASQGIGPQTEALAMSMGYDLSSQNSPAIAPPAPALKSLSSTSFYNTPPLTARDLDIMQMASAAASPQLDLTSSVDLTSSAPAASVTPTSSIQANDPHSTTSFYELPTHTAAPPYEEQQVIQAEAPKSSRNHVPFSPANTESTESGWGGPAKSPPPNPWAAAQAASQPAAEAAPEKRSQPGSRALQKLQKPVEVAEEVRPPSITNPSLGVPAALPGKSTPVGQNPGWGAANNQSSESSLSLSDNPGWKPSTSEAEKSAQPKPRPQVQEYREELPAPFAQQTAAFQQHSEQLPAPFQTQPAGFQQQPAPFPQQSASFEQQPAPSAPFQQQSAPFQQQPEPFQQQPAPFQQQPVPAAPPGQQGFQMQHQQGMQQSGSQSFPQPNQPALPHPQYGQQMSPAQQQQQYAQQQPQPQMSPPPMQGQQPQTFQQSPVAAPEQPQSDGWEFSAAEAAAKPVSDKPKGLNALMPKGKKDKSSS